MVSISTYGGWAGLAVIGAGYWYLQSRRTTTRSGRPATQKQINKSADARKEGKSKRQRTEGGQSGGEAATGTQEKSRKKRKEKSTTSKVADLTTTTSSFEDVMVDDEISNEEFARQFQNAKSGTIPASRTQASSRQKSFKQSQVKGNFNPSNTAGADTSSNDLSSTTGGDGDDDLSAGSSPTIAAAYAQPLQSGDVSDMLISSSAGPSVLRITEPVSFSQPKKDRKPAKSPEVKETKKQRQHRKKNEERKEAREDEEKERRVLMEKQRRTAREAEGRPAKDGSSFMPAQAPTYSAWTVPSTATNKQSSTLPNDVELLDTYDPTTKHAPHTSPQMVAAASEKVASSEWNKALPSEEEQMRLLEEETAWNTVTSKKAKKKGGDNEQTSGQKLSDNLKIEAKAAEQSIGSTIPASAEPDTTRPVTIVGDPSIDLSSFSYKGNPANAVLENGDGHDYGYTMEDDEWEVA